jgi:hypothetical protein
MRTQNPKQRLRERSEQVLRMAAMEDLRRRYPGRTTTPALPREGAFWRYLFVPLYRRVSWSFKQRAMRAARMTASGWPENARRFREPWRPPAAPGDGRARAPGGSGRGSAPGAS